MDETMRNWELGIGTVPEKNICYDHIDEPSIKRFIKTKATRGHCDYCGRTKGIIPLEDLVEFVMEILGSFYTDPANFMSYNSQEGGYQGNVYDAHEILQEHFELDITDNALFDDFYDSVDASKEWADEMDYYDSPADTLIYSWEYFVRILTHRSRYFFGLVKSLDSDDYKLMPEQTLARIGKLVKQYRLIKTIPAGTTLYRCRQHVAGDPSVTTVMGMTSPPDDFAVQPNRMSPAGISMFYGAFDEDTALKETVDPTDILNPLYTIAPFKTAAPMRIINLSLLPKVPSPFDLKRRKHYYPLIFMRTFIRDLVKPIHRDRRVHINYVPTQVITEYFRYPFSDKLKIGNRIQGLVYPSSKTGRNACVLFCNNKESQRLLTSNTADYKEYVV